MIGIKNIKQFFEPLYSRLLQEVGVPKDEVVQCMVWAIGSGWATVDDIETIKHAWNAMHKDLFVFKDEDAQQNVFRNIGIAWQGLKHDSFFRVEQLASLNQAEAQFRKILLSTFNKEGIHDYNEMMDCLSWGLGYDKELLRCHSYMKWPETFAKNTGILVNDRDSIYKVTTLLARSWRSKKKVHVVRRTVNV